MAGYITERIKPQGLSSYKYTTGGATVIAAVDAMLPYFRGYKREQAEALLERWDRNAA